MKRGVLRTTRVYFQTDSFWLTKPAISEDKNHEMLVFLGQNVYHVFHRVCSACFFNKGEVEGSYEGEKYHLLRFIREKSAIFSVPIK